MTDVERTKPNGKDDEKLKRPTLKEELKDIREEVKRSFVIADTVENLVLEQTKKKVEKSKVIEKEAKKAFENFSLSKVPLNLQESPVYYKIGDDINKSQKQIIQEDLNSILNISGGQGIKIDLAALKKNDLGLQLQGNTVSGQIDQQKVSNLINELLKRGELQLKSVFLSDCEVKQKAEQILNEVEDTESSSTEATEGQPSTGVETASDETVLSEDEIDPFIEDKVKTQMKHTTSPEGELKFGIKERQTEKDIGKTLETFEIKGGPADETAYHDFYDLQIAFRHVWTEMFDEKLKGLGELLFLTVELGKNVGVELDTETVSTVEELEEFKNDLRAFHIKVAMNDDRLLDVQKYLIPEITIEQWAYIDPATRSVLYSMVLDIKKLMKSGNYWEFLFGMSSSDKESLDQIKKNAKTVLKSALEISKKKSRIENMLEDLEERLKEPYVFDNFAPGTMNFGIIVNYRQEWKPEKYQVGELVKTIPLAPKETRRFKTRRIIKKSRATKEIEYALRIKREDSLDKYRDSAEIVRRANHKTNFKHNAEGGVNFAVWNAKGSHGVEIDSARHSSDIKKEMRESVLKAAQEYKNENRLEINSVSSEESEDTTSGEISNPNDEITVTYLFYELQRRYEIREKIHKLTPVVLVANKFPRPDEIDEDWLLANDWILRRVLLDDSYLPALDYLLESFVGDELAIDVLRNNWETQLSIVEKVSQKVAKHTTALDAASEAMKTAVDKYAQTQVETSSGLFGAVFEGLFGGDDDQSEMLRIKMEAAKEAFQRAERQDKDLRSRLMSEMEALEAIAAKYSNAIRDQFNKRTEILRLRVHVKNNIMYYMQAIWDQEPPDQRFFRLYDKPVIDFDCNFKYEVKLPGNGKPKVGDNLEIKLKITNFTWNNNKKLVEIADLDNLLGYKGNYSIFPMRKNNGVTKFMMQNYLDVHEIGFLRDPDELGSYTIEDLIKMIKCYRDQGGDDYQQEKKYFMDLLIKKLKDPRPDKETVVIPTDSLYIEALPGKHPILEDFKLIHRAVDVKKVQAEVRHDELENTRLAARVLKGEHEDPDIEKKIVIEGSAGNIDIDTE